MRVTCRDIFSVSSLFEFLAGVHRGGLSGRVVLESVVFLVQLKNVLILYFGTGFELKKF